ncbi:MAG TPA: LysM domain-containing protein, partial [Rectinemataceae bacterium]|nr:LysM domain-containing protein [Rectinemataceae bacterium]
MRPPKQLSAAALSPWLRVLLALLLWVAALGAPAAQTVYHVLAKGETLYSVARSYGVSVEAIAAANGIADPAKARVGQRLLIPAVHKVAKGETLFGIAKDYGVGVDELRSANRLKPETVIKVGDALFIPGAAAASSSSPGPAAASDPVGGTKPNPGSGTSASTQTGPGQTGAGQTGPGLAGTVPAAMKVSP